MKRIKLSDKLDNLYALHRWPTARALIVKLIQNGYRRRQYKQHGYTCNTCGKLHKPMQLCKEVVK